MKGTETAQLLRYIDQVGVVVPDLEKARKVMKKLFQAEPLDSGVVHHANTLYRDKPANCSMRCLCYRVFNIELEFVCPVDGDSAWKAYLEKHGAGIHHIRFNVENYENVRNYLVGQGIGITQEGDSAKGFDMKWAYFDTEKLLGFTLEILNIREAQSRGCKL